MDFSNEQITYTGRDVVEIPAVNKTTADLMFVPIIVMPILLMLLFIRFEGFLKFGILPVVILFMFGGIFLSKQIIFLLCSKKKVMFEFNNENFIYDGKTIKWADMRKIVYEEFALHGKHRHYHITIYYFIKGKVVKDILKKQDVVVDVEEEFNITKSIIFKMSSGKIAKLIADKFYRYYGSSNDVMLKKNILFRQYGLKPVSQKNILQKSAAQNTDNSVKIPKMFR
ncbi:MAG: hypothetical protein FWD54_06205 [Endomicrobia bacterium]|nr:hypothetical protein [Endomicrobiia bacterium]